MPSTMQQAFFLASVLAPHADAAFVELKALLIPFGSARFFTDGWGAEQRHLAQQAHLTRKSHPQTIDLTAFEIADTD